MTSIARFPAQKRIKLSQSLQLLMDQNRWVVWRWEDESKVPYCSLKPGRHASSSNSSTWSSYDEAVSAVAEGKADGIGFVLRESGVGALDLDNCRDPRTGKMDDWASKMIARSSGAYVEVTPSGTGVRIIGRARGPHAHTHRQMGSGKVEIYRNAKRYITITGNQLGVGRASLSIDDLIDEAMSILPVEKNGADNSKSGVFHKRVCSLAERGWSVDRIEKWISERLRRAEWECARKYAGDGRLRQEVARSWEKAELLPEKDTNDPNWGIRCLADVKRRSNKWLWYPYVALKEVTMLEGDPSGGKSWLTQILGKHACDGELRKLPSLDSARSWHGPLKVISFDADNSIDTITRARLEWAGCQHMENYLQREEAFSIVDRYEKVVEMVKKFGAKIVIFDIVNYYLVGDTSKADIATVLGLFKKLARECNCAVILVRWLTKTRGDGRAIQAGQGNMAFTGVVAVQVSVSKVDEDENMKCRRRIFAVSKCRLGLEAPPHDFNIVSKPTLRDPDRAVTEFGKYLEGITADDIAGSTKQKKDKSSKSLEEAVEWLQDVLDEGPIELDEVEKRAKNMNFSWMTIRRAASQLHIKKTGAIGRNGHSTWALPE